MGSYPQQNFSLWVCAKTKQTLHHVLKYSVSNILPNIHPELPSHFKSIPPVLSLVPRPFHFAAALTAGHPSPQHSPAAREGVAQSSRPDRKHLPNPGDVFPGRSLGKEGPNQHSVAPTSLFCCVCCQRHLRLSASRSAPLSIRV